MIGIIFNSIISKEVFNQQHNIIKNHIKNNPLNINATLEGGTVISYIIYDIYKGYFIDEEDLETEETEDSEDSIESFFF